MENTKHTPGPWDALKCALNPVNPVTIVSNNGVAVASIEIGVKADGASYEGAEGEFSANTKLIAAAPDLLEALQDMLHVMEQHEQLSGCDCSIGDQARAAISKATGVSA